MATLFSYCIPYDDGAAPNPFWGVCTLNICKPVIRRVARVGDWIVGTGSKRYGFENKVVYAMEVTETMSMKNYYFHCVANIPEKIPDKTSTIFERKVGDCIYDFSIDPPGIFPGVHDEGNRIRDLGGEKCLLSTHFYYFGDDPQPLPLFLLPIVKQGQSHKSTFNNPFFDDFVAWIKKHKHARNTIHSQPKSRKQVMKDKTCFSKCAKRDKRHDDKDEKLGCA